MNKLGPFIQTYTGKRFYPFSPDPEDICIEDIARHLSLICRFGGAARFHYSVAQHSVYVARMMLDAHTPEMRDMGITRRVMGMAGLMHDASEAYIGDMVRPLKKHMSRFMAIEDDITKVVYKKYGIDPYSCAVMEWNAIINALRHCDDTLLATERRDVMNNNPESLANWKDWVSLPEPLEMEILPLGWGEAEELFLATFKDIDGLGD